MSFDFENTIIQKLAILNNYLEGYSKEDLQKGSGIKKETINEDGFVEVDEITDDVAAMDVIKSIYNKMNLDSDDKVDENELAQFEDVLKAAGLSEDDVISAFEKYNEKITANSGVQNEDDAQVTDFEDDELAEEEGPAASKDTVAPLAADESSASDISSDEVEESDKGSDKAKDVTLSEFKKALAENDKLDDLVSEYGYDKVFDLLDKDGDGKLSEDEISKISPSSTSLDDVTYGEMKKFLEDNKDTLTDGDEAEDEEFQTLLDKIKEGLGLNNTEDTTAATPAVSDTGSTGGYSGGGGGSGGYGSSSSGGTGTSSTSAAATTSTASDDETLEQLEKTRDERMDVLSKAQENLSAVYDETDEEIAAKKDEMDEAEQEYNDALAEDAKSNPELAALKEEKDENDKLLDENEEAIKEKEGEINDTEQAIWEQEDTLSNLNSELDSLNASLSELQAIETNENNEESVAAKISSVESQIADKQNEIDKAQEELDKLNDDKEKYEGELDELNETNKELTEKRDQLEEDIMELASETTKEALEKFQQARSDFEEIKSERLETVQGEVEDAQESVEDINKQISEFKMEQAQKENSYNGDASKWLAELEAAGGDAWNDFDKLCSTLNMSREETMEYLTNLCESEEWGNGVIDPVTLCAQIRQESGYNASVVGDSGLALGLGQFHECAVQEVNNQYGTSYTSADRSNPNKALEMMVLLLKYDYSKTGSTEGMLAMYNQGNANGINTSGGQSYVNAVYSRLANA